MATVFLLGAIVCGLATITALPAYPVCIVGRSSFMGLANITCGHDYAILGQITADY